MSIPPSFNVDEKRDATASIRGYVYQIYQSVLAWILLKENEILVLEGAEDFDVYSNSSVVATQVKDVTDNLTLRSASVIDAINNLWDHKERNPDYDIILRFLTSAEAGQEKGSPFGPGQKGLEFWKKAELDANDIKPLRAFLLKQELSPKLKSFIKMATDDELREQLIRRIKWDMGNKQRDALQYNIEDKLKIHGQKLQINSHYSCQALPHLLKKVADLLSTQGKKELRYSDFLSCFDEATTLSIPRGKYLAMNSGSDLQQIAAMFDTADVARLVNISATIGSPMPTVDRGISRTAIVSNLVRLVHEQRILFLSGSSGVGKTNLASLMSREIGVDWGWASFRGMQPEQVKNVLTRISFGINATSLSPFLILDDIDLNQVTQFERELVSLVFSVVNIKGIVIITGPVRPPLTLLPKLWISEACDFNVPYFNETEVAEMVCAHGLVDGKRVSSWARTIWLTTSGHPQLVHARVRNLSARGWPAIEFSDLVKPEDVERVRSEARARLVNEFPTDSTRLLAYRLSLINGAFSRETAVAVAETPPSIKLPGEAFDALIGPWIEREDENRFRVSPLLTGAAGSVLSQADIKAVHGAIALSIIRRKSINQFEVNTALFHAFMAKHVRVLAELAHSITTTDSKKLYSLYDTMSWFTLVGLKDGQRILPEDPSVDLMLRLVQYKLITCIPQSNLVIPVIERIEETLKEIEPKELRLCSETLAYGTVLNVYDVYIPSSIVVKMLARMIDLIGEDSAMKDIAGFFERGQDNILCVGENKPAQILFSYQGARLSGLNDLSELIKALDALSSNKREQLLVVFNSDIDFASTLINRAWWKEVTDGTLDVEAAIQIFDFTARKSREWNAPELTKACLVAMSVIQDEYGHSAERALKILDTADKEFPSEASLVNQRAKVLFNANRNAEALSIANKALSLSGLSNVEYVFCCRAAGMAAANSGDWVEAERLFRLGAEKAMQSSIQKGMGIGLMADAAFALWKQKRYGDSILLFADTLDHLGSMSVSEDIRARYLQASIHYCISWVHFETRGEHPTDLMEPFPGVCSNQEPHEGIKDHRLVDIRVVWELLALTERILGLNIGIKDRSQIATGGNKSLLIARYERTVAFDSVFKRKEFHNLIPTLTEMLESLDYSEKLEKEQRDGWIVADIPKHSDVYWYNNKYRDLFYHYMLIASVICTADKQSTTLPVERWRTDLVGAGVLSNDIDQFLNVLSGVSPDESPYQQAAAAIFKLRAEHIAPAELWKSSFRLLNAFINERSLVEKELERLLITRWLYAARNQRFAFSSPSLACSEIEKRCLEQSLSGLSKIADVLDVSAPYLRLRLSTDVKKMIKLIIDQV